MRTSMIALTVVLTMGLTGAVASSSAHAQDPAVQPPGTEASQPDKSKKVCRTIVKSGTRFGTRICRSKADWDKDAENASRYLEKGQTYGTHRNEGITNVP